MIRLSIIVPVYNCEKFLSFCLDSIINQTYKDFELIIVNDGSTDGTMEIIKSYLDLDHRIRLIDKQHNGIISTVRAGIMASKGAYISFCDADDFCELDKYETLMKYANDLNCDVVACGSRGENFTTVCPTKEGLYDYKSIKATMYKNIYTLGGLCCRYNKVIKRDLLLNNLKFYDGNIQNNEDYLFHTSYFFDVKSIYILKKPLCNIRTYSSTNSTTKKSRLRLFDEALLLKDKLIYIYNEKKVNQLFKQTYFIFYNSTKGAVIESARSQSKEDSFKFIKKICNDPIVKCFHKIKWRHIDHNNHIKDNIFILLLRLRMYKLIYYLSK